MSSILVEGLRLHSIDDILNVLEPLKEEPKNRLPDEDKYLRPGETPQRWCNLLKDLIGIDRRIVEENLGSKEKIQRVFNQFVQSMVLYGFSINQTLGCSKRAPLHLAAAKDSIFVLRALIAQKADLDAYGCGTWGDTPLHEAAEHDSLKAAKMLIQYGADVTKFSTDHKLEQTVLPIHVAISPAMCELLVQHGCPVNALSTRLYHETALLWSVYNARPDTVGTLLSLGARDVTIPGFGSALDLAKRIHEEGDECGIDEVEYNKIQTYCTVLFLEMAKKIEKIHVKA